MAYEPSEELWYSPDWCDWRWRVYGCNGSDVWKAYNIERISHNTFSSTPFYPARLVLYGLLLVSGIWILVVKLWGKNKRILSIKNGAVKPLATEMFVITSTLHALGQVMFSSVILTVGFPNHILAEVFHDWPWVVLFSGCAFHTVGVIQAIPATYVAASSSTQNMHGSQSDIQVRRIRLPGPWAINGILVVSVLLPAIFMTSFAAMTGAALDSRNYEAATRYNFIHYLVWSFFNWQLAAISGYYGIKMVTVVRSTIADSKDLQKDAEFKRVIMQVVVSLLAVVGGLLIFGSAILIYALFRVKIHGLLVLSAFIGFAWFFASGLCIAAVFVATLYHIYRTKVEQKDPSSRRPSEAGGPGGKSDRSQRSQDASGGVPRSMRSTLKSDPHRSGVKSDHQTAPHYRC
ncbi:hypothetical protein DFJ77DRAFT_513287 [Powellomyces hirtus]|nr:hypothetical protein DFJ77DRAFT_513287 [Powellomyces hirtus]